MNALTATATAPGTCTEQARIDLQTAYDKANAKLQAANNDARGASWTARYFERMAAEFPGEDYLEDVDRHHARLCAAEEAMLDAQRAVAAYRAGLDALTAS